VPGLEFGRLAAPDWRASLDRLAPGAYTLMINTMPRDPAAARPTLEARPGVYYDMRKLDLAPGERASVTFEPPPFNPDAWRGHRSATVIIRPAGDRPLAGEEYRVFYTLANYGALQVAQGKLDRSGTIALNGIAPSGSSPYGGQYAVQVAGESLGNFRVKDEPERQEFPLQMPPRTGDLIVDAEAQDLDTGKPVRLSEFRGQVVLLEFWATWCGPCREPMQRLVALAKRRGESWHNDVALIAIGIDNDRQQLRAHVERNGLKGVRHLWSPQEEHARSSSSAVAAYAISGVPTAFLIGRDGRIAWRGHPQSIEAESAIDKLIKP
jgi:thiol-disulfide isomerase/thioredoxin